MLSGFPGRTKDDPLPQQERLVSRHSAAATRVPKPEPASDPGPGQGSRSSPPLPPEEGSLPRVASVTQALRASPYLQHEV